MSFNVHAHAQTFRSAERFQVKSQLLHTRPAHLVALDLSGAVQAHQLHLWNLQVK